MLSVFRDSVELPVAFYSRQLRGAETRYSASELEFLAVVDSVRHFQVYLHSRSFLVQTDHKALESLLSSTKLIGKQTRWALFLQQFKITIKYRPWVSNQNADGLSRQAWTTTDIGDKGVTLADGGDVGTSDYYQPYYPRPLL